MKRIVVQLTTDKVLLATFASICDAAYATGVNRTSIGLVCKGKQRSAGNFLWAYEENYTRLVAPIDVLGEEEHLFPRY